MKETKKKKRTETDHKAERWGMAGVRGTKRGAGGGGEGLTEG